MVHVVQVVHAPHGLQVQRGFSQGDGSQTQPLTRTVLGCGKQVVVLHPPEDGDEYVIAIDSFDHPVDVNLEVRETVLVRHRQGLRHV